AVADDIVALGGVARQRKLVELAVEEGGQRLAGAADARVFFVAEPREVWLAELLGRHQMVDGRAQHGKRRAAQGAGVEVDPVGGQQPLAAQLGPVAFRVGVQQFPRRQGVRSPAERFFGLCLGDSEECRSPGSTLDELAAAEPGDATTTKQACYQSMRYLAVPDMDASRKKKCGAARLVHTGAPLMPSRRLVVVYSER